MSRRCVSVVIVAVLSVGLAACSLPDDVESASASVDRPTTTTLESSVTTTSVPMSPVAETAPPPPPAAPATPGIGVADVVDGDTLRLVDGTKVRMIGIDTPERGQCGYREATNALTRLVGGQSVVLVPGARDDTDRYGRVLRYVEVGGVDVNLAMISAGWARSRYDSRDGYGRHVRQDAYIAADATSTSPLGCAVSAPAPASEPASQPSAGGEDPRFGSCTKARAAGFGPYARGVDVEYGWYKDGDGDGNVCE